MAFTKWISAVAVLASFGLVVPAFAGDNMSSDQQETVIPSDEQSADQETVLPAEEPSADVEVEQEQQETVLPSEEPSAEMPAEEPSAEQETAVPSDEQQQSPDINIEIQNEAQDEAAQEDVVPEDEGVAEEAVPAPSMGQDTIIVTEPRAVARPIDNFILELGGGASTFTGRVGDVLQGGAGWTGRAVIGARSPLGLELGYFGAANPIEGPDLTDADADQMLFTNAGEALARLNFAGARSPVKPFIAGGVNYTRFDSDAIDAFDNLNAFGIPLAAGLQIYPTENFTIGLRGDYRILTDWIDEDVPDADQWGGNLTLGANF